MCKGRIYGHSQFIEQRQLPGAVPPTAKPALGNDSAHWVQGVSESHPPVCSSAPRATTSEGKNGRETEISCCRNLWALNPQEHLQNPQGFSEKLIRSMECSGTWYQKSCSLGVFRELSFCCIYIVRVAQVLEAPNVATQSADIAISVSFTSTF